MAASSTVPARRAHRVAGSHRTHKRVSVSLPLEVFVAIRAEVGAGNVPGYLAEAVEEKRRRQALHEWLELMEGTHGPPSPEAEERAERIWNGTQ